MGQVNCLLSHLCLVTSLGKWFSQSYAIVLDGLAQYPAREANASAAHRCRRPLVAKKNDDPAPQQAGGDYSNAWTSQPFLGQPMKLEG